MKVKVALEELKELLSSNSAPQLPFSVEDVDKRKTHVDETLKKASTIREAIPKVLKEIGDIEVAAQQQRKALTALREEEKKVTKLKSSLELAEKSLGEAKDQEIRANDFLKLSEASALRG